VPYTPSPCAPPLLLLSLSHLDFPHSNLPLPLPPLSPRGALGFGDGNHRNLDPEVSSPPLLSLSLSLSLFSSPPSFFSLVHPPFFPSCMRAPRGRGPSGMAPRRRGCSAGAARVDPARARGPDLGPPARGLGPLCERGSPGARPRPPARARLPPAARPRPRRVASAPLRAAVLAPLRGVRPSD
jgi:hypothetical protein